METNAFFQTTHTVILFGTAFALLFLDWKGLLSGKLLKIFAGALAGYFFVAALLKSAAQYFVWDASPMTKNLLPDVNPAYFYAYSFYRFFLPAITAVLGAAVFAALLALLAKYSRAKWISQEEIWLAALAALLTGWPSVLLLMGFTFAFMILVGVGHRLFPKYIALRIPFAPYLFVSLMILLMFGPALIDFFHLRVMKV